MTPHRHLPLRRLALAAAAIPLALGACAGGRSSAADPAGADVAFGGVTFRLPDGWSVTEPERDRTWIEIDPGSGEVVAHHGYRELCVGTEPDGCTLRLYHGDAPGHEGFQGWDDDGAWPWHTSTDVDACPVPGPGRGSADPAGFDGVQPAGGSYLPAERGSRPVGDRTAVYRAWDAVCETSGYTFSPRSWHVPDADLVIVDEVGHPETESVLGTFRFG